ncbi:RagB/SusD family nutrient uptake outer membrane protein [Sphingobacterium sp.]|uniref:RagB/SusD family nutrient uptake outer membrane protein n=1 Tax=Sphingobacterium sp. TaxID=341027 RepID=UPI0031E1F70A
MMRRYMYFIAVGLIGVTSSCSKFLEESTQSEVVPRSAESLNEYMMGDAYPNDFALHPEEPFLNDDIQMIAYKQNELMYPAYTWQPDMPEKIGGLVTVSSWRSCYAAIQACNTTLDYLPKMMGEQRFKDYVGGQAYLLRAFYYFNLVNLYGMPYNDPQTDPHKNLAVPLLISGGVESDYKSRNTVAEVYAQIETDLKEGIRLIEGSGQVYSKYRMGSEAGHLLASRIYLYMDKWNEVIQHTENLMAGGYKLMDLRNWGEVKPLEKPVISINNPETIWAFGTIGDVIVADSLVYRMSSELMSSYEDGDLRKGIYWSNGITRKLSTADIGAAPAQSFRLSEVYLNRAEAFAQLYKQGNVAAGQKCLDLLNALREKRLKEDKYVPWTLQTVGNDLLRHIHEERRREFYSEGGRWFDLRRYGMPKITHLSFSSASQAQKFVLQERDPSYVWPIPLRVIGLNPKIVQNPLAEIRQPQ